MTDHQSRLRAAETTCTPNLDQENNEPNAKAQCSDKARDSDFLARPITLAFGANRDAGTWCNETRGSDDEFLSWLETPDSKHHEKDGLAFLQGTLKPGEKQRQAKNMDTMRIIAFDVESGERPEAIAQNAEQLGIELVIYPTFNHDKPETRIKTDAVHRWAKISAHDEATAEQVFGFLRKKKGYLPCIMDTAQFVGRQGHEYVACHDPLPRFRAVAVWRIPVKLVDLAPTLVGVKEAWKTVYYAAGAKLGIQHFDESCDDLSRLFYPHRRPKNAAPWSIRIRGEALDFAALLMETRAAQSQSSSSSAQPGRASAKKSKSTYLTADLAKFISRCAKHLRAADLLLAYGEDPTEANGGVQARCTNESEHSEADPPGKRVLWAMNAADTQHGVFVMKCQHETCKRSLKGGHYLDQLCQARSLTVDDLLNFVDEEGKAAWIDDAGSFSINSDGKPYQTQHNIKVALKKLDVVLSYNEFSGKTMIKWGQEQILQDSHVVDLWLTIEREYNFRPKKEYFLDVLSTLARDNTFHPVKIYLDDVQAEWDGIERLAGLFTTYFSAKDTPFNRAAAKCWAVAAVRRVRQPGCKFDEMIVVESPQGKGKSSAFAILAARPEWFSDNLALGAKGKELIELSQGKWIIEIPELHGMRKAKIERVKAQLSRQRDEARLSYGRIPTQVPRQFVFAGSSNNEKYLKDTTGNRRFWPIATGDIDLAGLKRDVDQLWAEAATLEAAGQSIRLEKSLWESAATVQAERQEENPFFDVLQNHFADREGRIRSTCVYELLKIPSERRKLHTEQVNAAMAKLGWKKKDSLRLHDHTANGFVKAAKNGKDTVWMECGLGLKELDAPNAANPTDASKSS